MTKHKGARLALLAALFCLPAGPVVAAPAAGSAPLSIADISLHLFYEGSGTLSADITKGDPANPGEPFVGWNTIIAEGSATEAASDLLAVVHLKSLPDQFMGNRPLTITASNEDGVLDSRVVDTFRTDKQGRVALALWLRDRTCAGELTIAAELEGRTVKETVTLACGE